MNDSVLFVLPDDKLGGAEQLIQMLALHLQTQYKRVHVVFLKKEQFFGWSGLSTNINLYFSNSSNEKGGLVYLAKQVRLISSSYNLTYTFSSHSHINGALGILRKLKILKTEKLIIRESTMVFSRFRGINLLLFKLFYSLGYGFADIIVCSTELMRVGLQQSWIPANKWNFKTLQNPINLERLNQLSNDHSFSDYFANNEFIVAAGRLIKVKGFDLLINAFQIIKNKYPNLNLLILGEGKEKNNLSKQIKMAGLENRIRLFGFVENPIPFFRTARVCVVSSLIEGFPNVVLQMMSQNSRVVSTTCAGGIDEISGLFICPPDDARLLAEKIDEALRLENTDMIRQNFDLFLNKNSIKNYVDSLLSLL